MKLTDIVPGKIYHDNKDGVREVLGIDRAGSTTSVRYRVLAAKQTQSYSYAEGTSVSLIGAESRCELQSFASWAKKAYSLEDGAQLLLDLQARKLKLSVGELAFMQSVLKEAGRTFDFTKGLTTSFDHTEGRAVSGLAKKGLLVRTKEAEMTPLGLAWLRLHAQEATEEGDAEV